MNQKKENNKDIPTQIKNQKLVQKRRFQIAEAAVQLFIKQGFHKTTTRQIAGAVGFSIGSLYEYISCKEDVLFLVCDAIHAEVEGAVSNALEKSSSSGYGALENVIREYIMVCHRMCDSILLVYQETRSLPTQWQKKILENEVRITGIFIRVIAQLTADKKLPVMNNQTIELLAHTISVLGHMWTFRRWFLARHYSIEDYIKFQTDLILGRIITKGGEYVN